ncbi:branched-chain amino acid transport system substrate-binding protein [Variovorax boronicumulans]|jgi:branched-chain amino acid transport system substrate-binding protein|uniref:Branched-chain amino acid transport system substrate-binding protein n=1 Tax=Variovorax boronicumulans TaxID=436515 RepID=A0AAW8CSQ9_9BURK|nr:ABC transporter substrate-binding protein [Variovorax boronicumulans]MDP9891284.1 branched-chain amino acid transport system substrate-binding protein [Variovorax boronicumulans]MDQ0051352.1 branched-chain amino acid transport system substrate-binding protein [Variovorax boronicumulans]
MSQASIRTALLAVAVVTGASLSQAQAQPVKVGLAMDLSGPFAVGGAEAKAGFAVAMKQLDGKLGGVPVEFVEADTAGNPDLARQVVERMLLRDKIDLFTGPVGSSVALAVGPPLFAAKVPYLSSNTGPSDYSGAKCNPYFFGASYPNDAYHEAAGKFASDKGFKKVALIAPSYPGGKDAASGFKRNFKGAVGDELYTKLGQLDYSAEIAQIRASKPDALYFFLPGAMGVSFIKQFVGAGLSKDVALISTAFSADEDMIPAVGEPMLGLFNTAHWSYDLDNPANQRFVAAFRQQNNGRNPSFYAGQAYDVLMAMDAAVRDAGGKVADKPALLKAIKAAKYKSVRGDFSYGANNFPIQNYYLRVIGKDASGRITNKVIGTVLQNYQDSSAAKCAMKS